MAHKKGHTNNPNGRPKGSVNKERQALKDFVYYLIDNDDNREQLIKDMRNLDSYQRISSFEKLLSYVMPKQQAVSAQIDLNNLSDEQLNTLVNELAERITNETN